MPFAFLVCVTFLSQTQAVSFPLGISAGDATDSAVILWTATSRPAALRAEVATDPGFTNIVASQAAMTTTDTGLTAKLDVSDLAAATRYHFRFVSDTGESSATGTFRTAPRPIEKTSFRFVYTGDSNAATLPFRLLSFAPSESADFWFWFGDTIYGDSAAGGLGVANTLDEYRAKYRQNLGDPNLNAMLASTVTWAGWDDHEVADDYDGGDPEPGIDLIRIAAGYKAFFEFIPIREQAIAGDERRLYRSFKYGALAEFFILDGRQYRSADAERVAGGGVSGLDPFGNFIPFFRNESFIAASRDPSRTMLGKEQLAWLKNAVTTSAARYKFIINPLPFTSLLVYPADRWDGYDAERYDLLRTLDLAGVEGVIVLTTDSHANTVNPDATTYLRALLGQKFSRDFAVPEFIAGPIGTGTLGEELSSVVASLLGGDANPFAPLIGALVESYALVRTVAANGLLFANPDEYAYLVVDVDESGVTLTHRGIPSRNIVPIFPAIPIFSQSGTAAPPPTTDTATIRDLYTTRIDERGRVVIPPDAQLWRTLLYPRR